MPLPTLISELSTTAASNFPAGSDSPSSLDDVQRAHAAFIATIRNTVGLETGTLVPATARTNFGAAASGPLASSGITGAAPTTDLRSYLAGCTLSTAGSSATMSIAAGVCQDSTNAATMTLTAIAKTTSSWVLGTAAGGLDIGAIANSTWYHFFVIRRPDTGVVDALISLSPTAPTMPTNYTQFRRIGSGRTNGSAQWTAFTQDGDYFVWSASVADVNTTNYGAGSAISATLTVPTGVKVDAMTKTMITDSASPNTGFLLTDLSAADETPTNGNNLDAFATTVGAPAICVKTIRTNTSAQVRYRNNGGAGANTTTVIRTVGWYDTRGRNA